MLATQRQGRGGNRLVGAPSIFLLLGDLVGDHRTGPTGSIHFHAMRAGSGVPRWRGVVGPPWLPNERNDGKVNVIM